MPAKRVRRSPEAARAEILEAAEGLLRDHDWALVSVDQLMERTGMTRSSFYHYFKSVDEVAVALFARVEDEIRTAVDDWLEGDEPSDDPETAAVEALTRMFDVWAGHITLMRAMEHAAGRSGAAYEQWRERLVEGYVAQTAAFIDKAVEEGRSDVSDPSTLARALILMNLSVATDEARRPEPFSAERLGRTIGRVWASAIYRNS
ncbi:MAG: TetR/AcrR family transcriptional regulator [bacterium]|nr:TetR/AcrR family transcriptional regulator [bacterium]